MSEKVTFKYFEGRDVEQFTFYRIPKQLFTLSCFKSLSSDAKILYGLMLDRISLSVKNQWFDEKNRAYIYFSIDDVMELLGCGKNKAIKCMKELDEDTGIGLTRKRRQGFGKSNMIYVKTFLVESQTEGVKNEKHAQKQTSVSSMKKMEPEIINNANEAAASEKTIIKLKSQENQLVSLKNITGNALTDSSIRTEEDTEKFDIQTNGGSGSDREVYISNFKKFKNETSRSPENKLQEVYFSNPNNTNKNKTEYSDLKSNRIVSRDIPDNDMQDGLDKNDAIRYDQDHNRRNPIEGTLDSGRKLEAIYALIRENIDLEGLLLTRERDSEMILEIYNLIVEMVTCRSEEIVIASNRFPAEIVRSRFLKLRYDHVIYVMDCLEKNTSKVKNIRKYLLATLFNAPATMDGYYRAEVRHDLPYLACGRTS